MYSTPCIQSYHYLLDGVNIRPLAHLSQLLLFTSVLYTDGMIYHLLDFADSVLLPNYDVVDTDLQSSKRKGDMTAFPLKAEE